MKFVCLGYADHSLFASMSESELKNAMEQCFAFDDELRRGGHFAGGEALQGASQAVTVRFRDGKAVATDGPFAETKEQIGGILFLEANDMAHAIELMTKHPGVKFGPFEIRPADESINALIEERNQRIANKLPANIELLLQVFQDHLGYIEQAVADIPDERLAEQPNGLVNHPAWSISHISLALHFLLGLLEDPRATIADEDQRRFGPGSTPTPNRSDYKNKSELLQELKEIYAITDEAVRAKHATHFPRESPLELRAFAPTIGRIATYLLASHEAYHLAQINQWRRVTGYLNS